MPETTAEEKVLRIVDCQKVNARALSKSAIRSVLVNGSRRGLLRIQPGHSDGCCGLEETGTCCLQSAIPLLVGMVLCLIWSNSHHLPVFKDYGEGWLSIIVPLSYALMAVFFAMACALVFLPVPWTAFAAERIQECPGCRVCEGYGKRTPRHS
jgi:hypothetical protein